MPTSKPSQWLKHYSFIGNYSFALAFISATGNLDKINKTFLPQPNDKLFLKPDTAKVKAWTGWTLYAAREIEGETRLLPMQYCSAKLPGYMAQWYPCELEAVGAVLSIDQVSH